MKLTERRELRLSKEMDGILGELAADADMSVSDYIRRLVPPAYMVDAIKELHESNGQSGHTEISTVWDILEIWMRRELRSANIFPGQFEHLPPEGVAAVYVAFSRAKRNATGYKLTTNELSGKKYVFIHTEVK